MFLLSALQFQIGSYSWDLLKVSSMIDLSNAAAASTATATAQSTKRVLRKNA